MSYSSEKGYRAEHAVVEYLSAQLGAEVVRPRTTSITAVDTGDVVGVPFVVSVKNHAATRLSTWVDELTAMVARSKWETGLVVHKRRAKGHPSEWYATTPLGLLLPMIDAYVDEFDR